MVTEASIEQKKAIEAIAKNQQAPPDLWTGSEVAAACRVHVKTIRRWAADGILRPIRIGRRKVLFSSAEVLDLVNNGTKPHCEVVATGSRDNGILEETTET